MTIDLKQSLINSITMKIFGLLNNRIYWLSILQLLVFSCASNKDIYKNPYQSELKTSSMGNSEYDTQYQLSQHPEWIYAVSKDFVVGYGYGRDIIEAKNAALNDIKAFIVKSLGETGNVVEVNFVQNSVSGRNAVESRETYLMKNQFENKYKPVINISVDRFDDYYYEKTGNSAMYFIKYNIDAAELNRIKNDYQKSQQKNISLAARTRHIVDSLTTFQVNYSIESLIERYNTISNYLLTTNLNAKDSLLLIGGLQNIRSFLNTVEIRIIEHTPGSQVRFGLFNGQTAIRSKYKPGINDSAILIDTLIQRNEIWELQYKTKSNLSLPKVLEIFYDLPYTRLTAKLVIPTIVIKPIFEIVGQILLSEFQKDAWNGKLKSLNIRMNFNSNTEKPYIIDNLEILLYVSGDVYPTILADNLNFKITPGVNCLAKTVKSDLPVRFFQAREMECDLTLYCRSGNSFETYHLKNIPISINNY